MAPIVVGFLALGLLTVPLIGEAQPAPRVYRVGFVSPTSPGPTFHAFRHALGEFGYVEGKNVIAEARFAEGRPERFPELVAEVLRSRIDVLVVGSALGALAAKKATKTTPVVFAGVIEPVASGIVATLARPGGNITGVTFGIGGEDFGGKWVEILKEAIPDVPHIAVLMNSASPAIAPLLPGMRTAARTLKVKLDFLDAGDSTKLTRAFAAIGASGARGVIVMNDPFFYVNRDQIVQFAASKRLPAMYFTNVFAEAGGVVPQAVELG